MKTVQSNSKDKRSYQSQYSVAVGYTPKRTPHNLATSCMPIAAHEPMEIAAAASYHVSIPISLNTRDCGSQKFVRQRTKADELAEQALPVGNRPTSRVIRMANALMLEQLLGTGQFASVSELARCIGIQKHLLSDLLALLNMPVAEIEKWLFETY